MCIRDSPEAVYAPEVDLTDVLVPNLPRVYPQAVHPAILPFALKLIAARKAVRAVPILEPSFPVPLIARAVRVEAHPTAVQLAVLDVPIVLALHRLAKSRPQEAG
eukprot:6735570-Prymnesium_polylepis.1